MSTTNWTIRRSKNGMEILAGRRVVATCQAYANACLIVCAPQMLKALRATERALLKANRRSDGSQHMNTKAAKLIAYVIAPTLDRVRPKTKGAAPKRRPRPHAGLPVQRVGHP